jgi:hypothetical protein
MVSPGAAISRAVLGGCVTWRAEEIDALKERYGGNVRFSLSRTKDGRWEARLIKGKAEPKGERLD